MLVGRKIKILHVEDDHSHAEIVQRYLEEFNNTVDLFRVKDGQEALDYLNFEAEYENVTELPDIILLDLRLPKVDGIEVLRILKDDKRLSAIPVVVFTTSGAESDITRAYQNNASSYLIKPVDYDEFTRVIKTLSDYWIKTNRFKDKKEAV